MKIITKNPVVINSEQVNAPEVYMNVDGMNSNDILAFQKWYNAENASKGFSLGPELIENGQAGETTKAAWKKYSKQYNRQRAKSNNKEKGQQARDIAEKAKGGLDFLKGFFGKDQSSVGTEYIPSTPEKRGLSTGAKIGIAVGVAAILGLSIWALTRKSK